LRAARPDPLRHGARAGGGPSGGRAGARHHVGGRPGLGHRPGLAGGAHRPSRITAGGVMLRDLFIDAARHIRSHWLRVLLTGSGIAWGIALFVALMAAGSATREHYREKMEAIGRKVIYTFPGSIPEAGAANRTVRHVELDVKDPPRLLQSPL